MCKGISGWLDEQVNEWMIDWMDEWVSEWVNEWMKEWMSKRSNERRTKKRERSGEMNEQRKQVQHRFPALRWPQIFLFLIAAVDSLASVAAVAKTTAVGDAVLLLLHLLSSVTSKVIVMDDAVANDFSNNVEAEFSAFSSVDCCRYPNGIYVCTQVCRKIVISKVVFVHLNTRKFFYSSLWSSIPPFPSSSLQKKGTIKCWKFLRRRKSNERSNFFLPQVSWNFLALSFFYFILYILDSHSFLYNKI